MRLSRTNLDVTSIVPWRGTCASVLLYVQAVLEIHVFYELHGFVYLGKHMSFWYMYFAGGTSRGSGEPAFSRQKRQVLICIKISEYDQEIPQSQTADHPMAPRGRAAQPSRDTRKTK